MTVYQLPPVGTPPACVPFDVCAELLAVFFPGGVPIQAGPTQQIPQCAELAQSLLNQLNVGLLPLVPIFDILQVLFDLADVVKALQPTPNPKKVADAITKLVADLDKLASLVPILTVPLLVKSILLLIIALLSAIRDELTRLGQYELGIQVSANRVAALEALPNGAGAFAAVQLNASIGCAQANVLVQLTGLQQRMAPLKQLICLLNELGQLASLPTIPCTFTAIDGTGVAVNVTLLTEAIAVLQAIADAIPIGIPSTDCSC